MSINDELIREVEEALAAPLQTPEQASAAVMNIFLLNDVSQLAADPRVAGLTERLRAAIHLAGFDNLRELQTAQASKLATASGALSYEDMYKLYSLLDDLHALRAFGLPADAKLEQGEQQLEADARARFDKEPKNARWVAEDKATRWSRSLWWYAVNLRREI